MEVYMLPLKSQSWTCLREYDSQIQYSFLKMHFYWHASDFFVFLFLLILF